MSDISLEILSNLFSKIIFVKTTHVNAGCRFLHAQWCIFRNFGVKGKVHFLKCERKTNITLIYASATLLSNVHFQNCQNIWDFMNTFFILWDEWSKGKIVTQKHNLFLTVPDRITKRVIFHGLHISKAQLVNESNTIKMFFCTFVFLVSCFRGRMKSLLQGRGIFR